MCRSTRACGQQVGLELGLWNRHSLQAFDQPLTFDISLARNTRISLDYAPRPSDSVPWALTPSSFWYCRTTSRAQSSLSLRLSVNCNGPLDGLGYAMPLSPEGSGPKSREHHLCDHLAQTM